MDYDLIAKRKPIYHAIGDCLELLTSQSRFIGAPITTYLGKDHTSLANFLAELGITHALTLAHGSFGALFETTGGQLLSVSVCYPHALCEHTRHTIPEILQPVKQYTYGMCTA